MLQHTLYMSGTSVNAPDSQVGRVFSNQSSGLTEEPILLVIKEQQEALRESFLGFSRTLTEVHAAVHRLETAPSAKVLAAAPTPSVAGGLGSLLGSGPGSIASFGGSTDGLEHSPQSYATPGRVKRMLYSNRSRYSKDSFTNLSSTSQSQTSISNPPQVGEANRFMQSLATADAEALIKGADGALQIMSVPESAPQIHNNSMSNVQSSHTRWNKAGRRKSETSTIKEMASTFFSAADSTKISRCSCWSSCLGQAFVDATWFGAICALIITADATVIAFETDDTADTGVVRQEYEIVGYCFTAWYLLELCLRLFSSSPLSSFYRGKDRYFNMMDVVLVSISVLDFIFQTLNMTSIRVATVTRIVRALRLLRVVRVLRIVRFMSILGEFYKLTLCLASSLQTLACAMLMLAFVLFCFSVFFVQIVSDHMHNGAPSATEADMLDEFFGSVARSMLSLFMAITSGQNWGDFSDLLLTVHPLARLSFVFYLCLTIFGLTNVTTAVFVESAMQATQKHRDLLVQGMMLKERATIKHMKEIFKSIDVDGSGLINLQEMQVFMDDERLQLRDYLEALDLSASDTWTLFHLMDTDGSGRVDIDEFCDGCLRLGGPAKSFDVNCMWYEQRRTNREILKFIQSAIVYLHGLSKGGLHANQSEADVSPPGAHLRTQRTASDGAGVAKRPPESGQLTARRGPRGGFPSAGSRGSPAPAWAAYVHGAHDASPVHGQVDGPLAARALSQSAGSPSLSFTSLDSNHPVNAVVPGEHQGGLTVTGATTAAEAAFGGKVCHTLSEEGEEGIFDVECWV